jgi:hypothetical protein
VILRLTRFAETGTLLYGGVNHYRKIGKQKSVKASAPLNARYQ